MIQIIDKKGNYIFINPKLIYRMEFNEKENTIHIIGNNYHDYFCKVGTKHYGGNIELDDEEYNRLEKKLLDLNIIGEYRYIMKKEKQNDTN